MTLTNSRVSSKELKIGPEKHRNHLETSRIDPRKLRMDPIKLRIDPKNLEFSHNSGLAQKDSGFSKKSGLAQDYVQKNQD